jgi:hypothetical protein
MSIQLSWFPTVLPAWYDESEHRKNREKVRHCRRICLLTRLKADCAFSLFTIYSVMKLSVLLKCQVMMTLKNIFSYNSIDGEHLRVIESWLLRTSSSLSRYEDTLTLKDRLKDLALRHRHPETVKAIVTEKVDRLVYLCHSASSSCQGNSACMSKHCKALKSLWTHMRSCRNSRCEVPHCYSSKVLITQFGRCLRSNPIDEACCIDHAFSDPQEKLSASHHLCLHYVSERIKRKQTNLLTLSEASIPHKKLKLINRCMKHERGEETKQYNHQNHAGTAGTAAGISETTLSI